MIMKKINSISLAVISVCTAAFVFSSCQKEIVKGVGDNRYVSFSASVETGMETKAQGSRMESVDLSEEGASLFVTSSVSVNRMTPFGSDVITKGSVVGSGFTSFNVNMVDILFVFSVRTP